MIDKEIFMYISYDMNTGIFKWIRDSSYNKHNKGKEAGCFDNNGYRVISVNRKRYYAHRLAWLVVHGSFPDSFIDHIDGNPGNNKISNLRLASRSINGQNQKKANIKNKLGLIGCYFNKNENKFRAAITLNKKSIHLGYFDTAEEAHNAYIKAKRELHEGCTI